jgi:hypothetical protein
MRGFLLFLLLTPGLTGSAWAQQGFVPENTTLSFNVFDQSGKAFVNPAPDVAGSPFLAVDWKYGTIVVSTNRRYDSVRIRLNLYSQEVHVLSRNNVEIALFKGYVKEVVLPPVGKPGTPGQMDFVNGFPAVDAQDENSFYQVVVRGKLWLLMSSRKIIATERDDMAGEVRKEYKVYEDYYAYDGKSIQRIRKDKTFIESLLADRKDKVEAFIADNKLKLRSMDEIQRLIEYYDTLLQ